MTSPLNPAPQFTINDTTLRGGEQSAGLAFSDDEKLAIEPEHVPPLLERIRAHVMHTKREPSADDLAGFFLDVCTHAPDLAPA